LMITTEEGVTRGGKPRKIKKKRHRTSAQEANSPERGWIPFEGRLIECGERNNNYTTALWIKRGKWPTRSQGDARIMGEGEREILLKQKKGGMLTGGKFIGPHKSPSPHSPAKPRMGEDGKNSKDATGGKQPYGQDDELKTRGYVLNDWWE